MSAWRAPVLPAMLCAARGLAGRAADPSADTRSFARPSEARVRIHELARPAYHTATRQAVEGILGAGGRN